MDLTISIVMAEYLRMFAYAVVIISIPFELRINPQYSKVLLIGDIFFAIMAFLSIPYAQVTKQPDLARLIFITPSTIIWAIAYVINLSMTEKRKVKKLIK